MAGCASLVLNWVGSDRSIRESVVGAVASVPTEESSW